MLICLDAAIEASPPDLISFVESFKPFVEPVSKWAAPPCHKSVIGFVYVFFIILRVPLITCHFFMTAKVLLFSLISKFFQQKYLKILVFSKPFFIFLC